MSGVGSGEKTGVTLNTGDKNGRGLSGCFCYESGDENGVGQVRCRF